MARRAVVIFADADAWRVGVATRAGVSVVDAPFRPGDAPDGRATALAEALRAAGVDRGEGVVLALGSSDCLCATIHTAGLPARGRGQAMLYRLEERLPVSAEEIVADFVTGDAGTALGVGVEKRVLQPIAEMLDAAGVRVRATCPATLLALQHWATTTDVSVAAAGSAEMVLCGGAGPGDAELFVLAEGRPTAWYVFPAEAEAVALHARMAMLREPRPTRLVTWGMAPDVVAAIAGIGVPVEQGAGGGVHEAATAAAGGMIAGRLRAWIDLADGGAGAGRSGRAGRTSRAWAAAAGIVLLACVAAGTLGRAGRYERLVRRYEAEQEQVFRQALPGQPVPGDVRSRLASETRQAVPGSSGRGLGGDLPSGEGLVTLRDLMAFLPADVRFRVFDVRLDGDDFVLEGEANAHGDAEAIAAALRRRTGFAVEPPRTEQRPGRGVGFTISGGLARSGPAAEDRRASR